MIVIASFVKMRGPVIRMTPCSREFKLQGVPVVCTVGVRHLYTVGPREVEGNSTNTSVLKTYLFRALH